MGVDSFIFDEVSKDCLYFDRRHNLLRYNDTGDPKADEIVARIYDIEKGRATAEEIAYLCDVNIRYYRDPNSDTDRDRSGWMESIKKFALARPSGSFFTASDHDWRYSWDIIRQGGYRIVGHDKDLNEVEGLL